MNAILSYDPRCPYEVFVGLNEKTMDTASAEDELGIRAAVRQLLEDQLAAGVDPLTLKFPRVYYCGHMSVSLTCAASAIAKELLTR